MKRALLLILVLLATGCPGLRRPPPSAQRATSDASPTPTTGSTDPDQAAPTPVEFGPEQLKRRLDEVQAQYQRFLAEPNDHANWELVHNTLQEVEDEGFALLDTTDDPQVEDLLEQLADLRAELSEREP